MLDLSFVNATGSYVSTTLSTMIQCYVTVISFSNEIFGERSTFENVLGD